jgi:hypothetical protein
MTVVVKDEPKQYRVTAQYITVKTQTSEGKRVVGLMDGAPVPVDVAPEDLAHLESHGLIAEIGKAPIDPRAPSPRAKVDAAEAAVKAARDAQEEASKVLRDAQEHRDQMVKDAGASDAEAKARWQAEERSRSVEQMPPGPAMANKVAADQAVVDRAAAEQAGKDQAAADRADAARSGQGQAGRSGTSPQGSPGSGTRKG